MREYDAIVIGTGRALSVAYSAVAEGLETAVVEMGPPGGTCLNAGCIPSKFLIAAADRIMEIREASVFGITARVMDIDFGGVMKAMRDYVGLYREKRRKSLMSDRRFAFYPVRAEFTGPYTLRVGREQIRSNLIFVASGARPAVPAIAGLDEIDYHTNETVLKLESLPKSMIIVGGGYIGVEYAHFFSAMGSDVTIVEVGERLLGNEEPEISDLLEEKLSARLKIHTRTRPVRIGGPSGAYVVTCQGPNGSAEAKLEAEAIMVAVGRRPNSDLVKVERSGVEIDSKGFIKVNEFFETSKEGIWSFGDAIGKAMFTHAGGREAELVWANAYRNGKRTMDYSAVPHAVFSRPQIASVGLTQAQAVEKHDILIGKAEYRDVVKGAALRQESTFAKAILEAESRRLLGFHIIGPYAPMLIQEVTDVIAAAGRVDDVTRGLHIHPAMSELIPAVLRNPESPKSMPPSA